MILANHSLVSKNGFSFLEILGAVVILSMSIVVIMDQQTRAMNAVSRAQSVDQATALALGKMNELEQTIASKGISALKEQEEGKFDEEQFPGYRWKYWKKNVPAPDFDAIAKSFGGGDKEDGKKDDAPQTPAGPLQMISKAWGESLAEIHLQVLSGSESSPRTYELVTHVIAGDVSEKLDALTRSLSALGSAAKSQGQDEEQGNGKNK